MPTNYITDDAGKVTAVILSIKEYKALTDELNAFKGIEPAKPARKKKAKAKKGATGVRKKIKTTGVKAAAKRKPAAARKKAATATGAKKASKKTTLSKYLKKRKA